jgi:hypothetical protein
MIDKVIYLLAVTQNAADDTVVKQFVVIANGVQAPPLPLDCLKVAAAAFILARRTRFAESEVFFCPVGDAARRLAPRMGPVFGPDSPPFDTLWSLL